MCAALEIQIIPAGSRQAKGRVERNHGTHQDRLVKKLRRLGIAEMDAANAFLETTYLPEHNGRFAVPPASAEDFHRGAPGRTILDRVFQLEEERVLWNDWVVRYATRYFQVARARSYAPARSTMVVREVPTGRLNSGIAAASCAGPRFRHHRPNRRARPPGGRARSPRVARFVGRTLTIPGVAAT
jgi:hypothetical protein